MSLYKCKEAFHAYGPGDNEKLVLYPGKFVDTDQGFAEQLISEGKLESGSKKELYVYYFNMEYHLTPLSAEVMISGMFPIIASFITPSKISEMELNEQFDEVEGVRLSITVENMDIISGVDELFDDSNTGLSGYTYYLVAENPGTTNVAFEAEDGTLTTIEVSVAD